MKYRKLKKLALGGDAYESVMGLDKIQGLTSGTSVSAGLQAKTPTLATAEVGSLARPSGGGPGPGAYGAAASLGTGLMDAIDAPNQYGNQSYGVTVGKGALTGAAAGATIGSAVPGIGTAIGAVGGAIIGGVSGVLNANRNKKREKKMFADQLQARRKYDNAVSQALASDAGLVEGYRGATYYKNGGLLRPYALGGPTDPPATLRAPKDTLADNTLYNRFITPMAPAPVNISPADRLRKVEIDAYDRFNSKPQKAYTGEVEQPLVQGRMRGATPNKELLNDLVVAADNNGVPRSKMLSLAANESMFGMGYQGGSRRGGDSRGILQQNVISSWNMDQDYRPVAADKFAYNKHIPGVTLDKDKSGYRYTVADPERYRSSLDSALNIHPEWIDEYARANANVKPQGDINYLDLTAKALKTKGLSSNAFNPGDPNYEQKILALERDVTADPVLKKYVSRAFGGPLNVDSTLRANARLPFVDRIINADKYPVRKNSDGTVSTHLMAWASDDKGAFAYPTLRLIDGQWSESKDPRAAITAGDYIRFNSDEDAAYFTEHYKTAKSSKIKMENGGALIKPENRGKFTRWAKDHNMSVAEATSHVLSHKDEYSTGVKKMAQFSRNFGGHATGGMLSGPSVLSQPTEGGTLEPLNSQSTEVVGPSHNGGGVDLPQIGAQVEGGETTTGNFVFSKELGFAKLHRPIARAIGKIEQKPQTPDRRNALQLLKAREERLALTQELVKAQNGIS